MRRVAADASTPQACGFVSWLFSFVVFFFGDFNVRGCTQKVAVLTRGARSAAPERPRERRLARTSRRFARLQSSAVRWGA